MSQDVYDYRGRSGGNPAKVLRILIYILLCIIAILLGYLAFRSCSSPAERIDIPATPPNPDLGDDDIVPGDDSLTFVVNKRIIIVIQNEKKSKKDFINDFYKVYRDPSTYVLSSPDDIIPRFVLTLPAEEKDLVSAALPSQFPDYDLLILPDSIFSGDKVPSDPGFSDATKRWYFDMIGVYDAWEETMGDENMVIAIIDDGFDLSHPEFKNKVWKPYNAVIHNNDVFPSELHGTHVAATAIGRADNGAGVSGIAPECKFMPVQVGDKNGRMAYSSIIDGILYAITENASVVNLSLGMVFPPETQLIPPGMQRQIIENYFLEEEVMWRKIFGMGIKKGITFVIAGGNQNILIGMDPIQRIDGTIRVSAVNSDKTKADFSNYGPYSVLSAPGVDIYNAAPYNDYKSLQGTSMASPIVAGCVALMKCKNSSLTTDDIITILQKTGIPSPSDVAPIVNFRKAMAEVPSDGTRPVFPGDDDCASINQRYQELLAELEKIQREHPGCITPVDTLVIPPTPTLDDLFGLWKSTTPLHAMDSGEELTLYYSFNGTPHGTFWIVDPSGNKFMASLDVSIIDETIHIVQTSMAVSSTSDIEFYPYTTDCKPNYKTRKAECAAVNQMDSKNRLLFNLVKIN